MVPEYRGEPHLASNSEVYSKILQLNKEFHTKRRDKQRTRSPRLRRESNKEQFRFSDENEHSSACQ